MELNEFASQIKKRTDDFLAGALERFDDSAPRLKEAMRYGLLLGGKRSRPLLVHAAGRLCGAGQDVLDYPAAAVECIHAYSLIHDDMPEMDNDEFRRGQPSVHVKFGQDMALLAGDALQTMAFGLLSDEGNKLQDDLKIRMVGILSSGAGYMGMCGGQALDLMGTNREMSTQELEVLHRKKTGRLIQSAVLMGASCSPDTGERQLALLREYAGYTGLAFQVWDDILDVIGDEKVTGKKSGADAALGKSTYPALLGLEKAKEYAWELCSRAIAALEGFGAEAGILRDFARFAVNRDH